MNIEALALEPEMCVLTIGDLAAHLTRVREEYVSPSRVGAAIQRLVDRGELVEHRAGRQRIVFESDLSKIESEFGVTAEMVAAAEKGARP